MQPSLGSRSWPHWDEIKADTPDFHVRRVLMNTFLSGQRRRWTRERPTAELPDRPGADELTSSELRQVIWRALSGLPARQRAVVVLRYFNDLSEAQTAQALDCSDRAARTARSDATPTHHAELGCLSAQRRRGHRGPTSHPRPLRSFIGQNCSWPARPVRHPGGHGDANGLQCAETVQPDPGVPARAHGRSAHTVHHRLLRRICPERHCRRMRRSRGNHPRRAGSHRAANLRVQQQG